MKHLVIGATGLLGGYLLNELNLRGNTAIGVGRRGPDFYVNLLAKGEVSKLIVDINPDVVWNAAAEVNLEKCEVNPRDAFLLNAAAVDEIAKQCESIRSRLVQISTDHFYAGGLAKKHCESDPVDLVNEYARSKYEGEKFALINKKSLVLRTNIVGFRNHPGMPTFADWLFSLIEEDGEGTLYSDMYTSTIDARTFCTVACDLEERGASGVVNLASSEVSSKETFIKSVAERLGKTLTRQSAGSVKAAWPRRADSLGLDVGLCEKILGYELPNLEKVVENIVNEYRGLR